MPHLRQRARFELRSAIGPYPRLFLPLARFRQPRQTDGHALRPRCVDRRTDLVLEGFPRSANTFALVAFLESQTAPVRVAHHLHAAAQVIAGVRLELPVLVLSREPLDAVTSFAVREPDLSLEQAVRAYRRFYRPLLTLRERIVVATFEQVVEDFGAVIRRLNRRFGRDFGVFEHRDANVRSCFSIIEERNRGLYGGHISEAAIARPSPARRALHAGVRRRLGQPPLADELRRCRALRAALLAGAGDGAGHHPARG